MEMENNKQSAGKLALVIALVVVLVAALIALVFAGTAPKSTEETDPTEVVYTIPADGNPDDETAKGSYTAEDAAVLAAGDTVVARIGEYTLTNGELQAYYWMEVQGFLNNYGSYAQMFGLDYTKPLDQQVCAMSETGSTWQQFFLAGALNTWMNYQTLSIEAEAAGYEINEQAQAVLDTLEESLTQDAALYGMETAEEFLAANVGGGITLEDYAKYVEQSYRGVGYYNSLCDANRPSAEEVEAYFNEHEADFEANGLTREDKYVSVRHVLIMPEGADSSTIRSETFDDAAWAAAKTKADELYAQFEAGDKSEDSFADLAMQYSQDGSAADGGLYTDVEKGQMVEAFENWCFDEARQPGDYGLVETEFGYHLMYFVSSRPVWVEAVEQELLYNISGELLSEILAKYEMEAEFDKMLIAYVNLGGEPQQTEVPVQAEPVLKPAHKPLLVIAGISAAALVAVAYVLKKKETDF